MISQSSNALCTTRNDRIFEDKDTTVEDCKRKLSMNSPLLPHKAQQNVIPAMEAWLQNGLLNLSFLLFFSPL
jgi:hypothetical protein